MSEYLTTIGMKTITCGGCGVTFAMPERLVGKGVCPCCNRTFADLGKHMETKHPHWSGDQGEK